MSVIGVGGQGKAAWKARGLGAARETAKLMRRAMSTMGTMQMSPLIVVFIIFSSKDHITYCDFCG
jgi:hypothetical protein